MAAKISHQCQSLNRDRAVVTQATSDITQQRVQERATSQQLLAHPWVTLQATTQPGEPAEISHQDPKEIIDIIHRARVRNSSRSLSQSVGGSGSYQAPGE